jgi:hypothetical protein
MLPLDGSSMLSHILDSEPLLFALRDVDFHISFLLGYCKNTEAGSTLPFYKQRQQLISNDVACPEVIAPKPKEA